MSKKKKVEKEISATEAAERCGISYIGLVQRIKSKRNPLPAHKKTGHGNTWFINVADLKKYKANPVGWPEGLKKKDANNEKA